MDAGSGEYHLSCELRGHEADVRGVCVCGDTGIATSSRDKTVKFWVQNSDHGYMLSKTLAEHTNFIGPLAWIAPCNDFPEGGIVSGGLDTMILLWDLKSARTVHRMSTTAALQSFRQPTLKQNFVVNNFVDQHHRRNPIWRD